MKLLSSYKDQASICSRSCVEALSSPPLSVCSVWFLRFSALKQQTRLIKEGWQEIQPLGLPTQGLSVKDKSSGVCLWSNLLSLLLLHLRLFVEAVLHFPLLISSYGCFLFYFSFSPPILYHFVINLTLIWINHSCRNMDSFMVPAGSEPKFKWCEWMRSSQLDSGSAFTSRRETERERERERRVCVFRPETGPLCLWVWTAEAADFRHRCLPDCSPVCLSASLSVLLTCPVFQSDCLPPKSARAWIYFSGTRTAASAFFSALCLDKVYREEVLRVRGRSLECHLTWESFYFWFLSVHTLCFGRSQHRPRAEMTVLGLNKKWSVNLSSSFQFSPSTFDCSVIWRYRTLKSSPNKYVLIVLLAGLRNNAN